MGRLSALIPIALALIIAVVGSVLIYNWMQQQAVPERVTQEIRVERPETIQVAVAAMNIGAGERLQREMITTGEYIKKSLPQGHFTNPDDLQDRIALAPIRLNEPIIEHRLAPIDVRTGGVSAVISEGMRAVAIGGDKVIGISGFIHSGNRVDILVTWTDPDTEEQTTKQILENILVLATGTVMQETERGTTAPVDVYTLEVTPEEAEILTHSRNQGRIQLALRNPVDSEPVLTQGATAKLAMDYLHNRSGIDREVAARQVPPQAEVPAPPPAPAAELRPAPPSRSFMRVIQGDRIESYEFQ